MHTGAEHLFGGNKYSDGLVSRFMPTEILYMFDQSFVSAFV